MQGKNISCLGYLELAKKCLKWAKLALNSFKMYLIQSMVMYKPVFHDSIIAVSIAVRYTISPKLVTGDATFYHIASLFFFHVGFFKLGPILAILVNSMYLEYWSIGIFFPLHYFLYNDFQA